MKNSTKGVNKFKLAKETATKFEAKTKLSCLEDKQEN